MKHKTNVSFEEQLKMIPSGEEVLTENSIAFSALNA